MDWLSLGTLLHSYWTVWMVVLFTALVVYALWPSNRDFYQEAGRIPFKDDGSGV
ncbi:MAG: CcoQ/FixQ family Cbb3-type cytochrome c oxidase assembly chaperone [Azospirillum sp.]|nr:CcoQ/FixQ family Cbb3-type cytochrome c oxidase assembly chaperone [Azospirillum sp.]